MGYFYFITAPSKENKTVNIYVEKGSTYSTISTLLKDNGLIRNEIAYKVYLKLNPVSDDTPLEYGDYVLKTNYDVEELIGVLKKGSVSLAETVKITFVEGKNIRYFVKKITENFKICDNEIFEKLEDKEYLNTLIKDYWFLSDDIKNKDIYYSLEGYLFPDTYEFYESADIDDIFRKMLDNFGKKIEPYKEAIESSKYSVHELVTLASIIELEAGGADRNSVSGVFYNRLKKGMTLGSDVTGYYGAKMDDWSKGLGEHVSDCNPYNTRGPNMEGKIPVGPISSVSKSSIEAVVEPNDTNYLYFVADKNGKMYFTETNSEHLKKINELILDVQ